MQIKGVIFDLDGVICSTDEYHYQAWKRLADRLGIPFDRTVNERLRGVSRMDSLNIVLEKSDKKYTEAEKQALAQEKNATYVGLLSAMSPQAVSEEVRSTLQALKAKGIKIAIGSSSRNTRTILTKTGIIDWFDAISDGTNITRSKPDPEVFLKAAEFIALSPANCLVVEDAESGIDAAKAGGFTAVGIGGAAKYSRTDYPIGNFFELLKLI